MVRLLAYVEDPGGVSMAAPLFPAMHAADWDVQILAHGKAVDLLKLTDLAFDEFADTDAALETIESYSPDACLVTTAENRTSPGLALSMKCKSKDIPLFGLVDAPMNAGHRFSGETDEPLAFAPDIIFVPDVMTEANFIDIGCAKARVIVSGHPLHDELAKKGQHITDAERRLARKCLFPEVPDDKKIVVFLGELSTGIEPEMFMRSSEYTLHGTSQSPYRTDIVIEEVLDAIEPFRQQLHFAIRPHPKNVIEDYSRLADKVDSFMWTSNSHSACLAADLIIGMTTSLLFEAWLLSCPVLSVLPKEREKQWLPALWDGRIKNCTTRKELQSTVSKWLQTGCQSFTSDDRKLNTTDLSAVNIIMSEILSALNKRSIP